MTWLIYANTGASFAFMASIIFFVLAFFEKNESFFLKSYQVWWQRMLCSSEATPIAKKVPQIQFVAVAATILLGIITGERLFFMAAMATVLLPPFVLSRKAKLHRKQLEGQVDGMLTALANAFTATPNIGDAMASLLNFISDPMKGEIKRVLGEIKLGRTLDEALKAFAERSDIKGIETAVAAMITGRRTGGDLPLILKQTAAAVRESTRLEGMLRTKTAEGRNQAMVMGIVPLFLIVVLQKIDPDWLAPMWSDPFGWILLGAAALLEVVAILLVKKIMAVEL